MTSFKLIRASLQLLCVIIGYTVYILGIPTFLLLSTYLLFYTNLYWLPFLYMVWIIYDRKTPDQGGRSYAWFRNLCIWKNIAEYFPMNVVKTAELDPKENYLFCVHPHGVYFSGSYLLWGKNKKFSKLFPGIHPHLVVIPWFIKWILLTRDVVMLQGGCSSSESSIRYLLSEPGGGHAVVLSVGGSEEVKYAYPGVYKFYIKKRSGFARIALLHGTPIVPVILFGENDLYTRARVKDGTILKWFFNKVFEMTKIELVIPWGAWFYIPLRKPVFAVVGTPIKVEKIEEPNKDKIEELKQKYIKEISELFEREKHKYVNDSENTCLEIV